MGKVYAIDSILRGGDQPLQAGDEVPDTYLDLDGQERQTDFKRLQDLGLTTEKKAEADAAKSAGNDAEIQALRDRVAELEAELAKAEAAKSADGGGSGSDGLNVDSLDKPALEKLAAERNLDVKGTGKDGAVKVEDLRKALKA